MLVVGSGIGRAILSKVRIYVRPFMCMVRSMEGREEGTEREGSKGGKGAKERRREGKSACESKEREARRDEPEGGEIYVCK